MVPFKKIYIIKNKSACHIFFINTNNIMQAMACKYNRVKKLF